MSHGGTDGAADAAPRAIVPADHATLLALNNAHAQELSWQSPQAFAQLLRRACHARTIGDHDGAGEALLIALDQDADYDNPNFAWFRQRHRRFVYIDRVVVAAHARGRGHALRLYRELIDRMAHGGHARLVCEINLDPPNPASVAFHQRLGFQQTGQARLASGKSVGYFERAL